MITRSVNEFKIFCIKLIPLTRVDCLSCIRIEFPIAFMNSSVNLFEWSLNLFPIFKARELRRKEGKNSKIKFLTLCSALHSRTRIFHFRYFISLFLSFHQMKFFIIMHHKWLKSSWDLIRIFSLARQRRLVREQVFSSVCFIIRFNCPSRFFNKIKNVIFQPELDVYILRKRIRKMALHGQQKKVERYDTWHFQS